MQTHTDRQEYMKLYREHHYSKTRKIVTFPLLIEEFSLLEKASGSVKQKPNAFSKNVVVNFLHSYREPIITDEQKAVIKEYIRISRGIANNINQLAYQANIGQFVDVNILFGELKHLEDSFKHFITNGKGYDC